MRNPTLPTDLGLQVELPTIMPRSKTRPSVHYTAAQRAIEEDPEIPYLTEQELVERIQQLRKERNAVILAHNYQIPIIQDLADFVGDSLQLAQQAAKTDADVIVFCGVHFMAETAAILNPERTVLIPDPEAGCSLAATVTAEEVRQWKANHPNGVVVAYVNTNADVKAEADYCCTSSNAVQVVQAIPEDKEILFLPDMFLGLYVQRMTGRKIHLWMGECHVHAGFRAEEIGDALRRYPEADLLLHPECGCVSQCMFALAAGDLPPERTYVYGTGGMVRHVRQSPAPIHLIATEVGMLHRLRKEAPNKQFIPVKADAICEYMKTITLPKLYRSLRDMVYEVRVEEPILSRARHAIERMLEIT
ncbi:MAG: quinolinate synthase NadA [Fimbriimonadales bacterium]|nr:quinolinate synthase NadA [Fimbriimonadales bacterium]MDW8051423.1 quinolinate synthase NadA [Armatimonadota bacterium]